MVAARHSDRMRVGVMLERRRIAHAWQDYAWHSVAIVPGAAPIDSPRLLSEGDGWARYHAATLDVELFTSETEGYRYNLSQAQPVVYALWRTEHDDPESQPSVFHVTVCPYEAEDYLDTGDVIVEGVPMPEVIALWVADYVARYHVDAPFAKRKRRRSPDGKRGETPVEDEIG
jgi:hypothetical protein